jgi:hypothetical protein
MGPESAKPATTHGKLGEREDRDGGAEHGEPQAADPLQAGAAQHHHSHRRIADCVQARRPQLARRRSEAHHVTAMSPRTKVWQAMR